MLTRYELKKKIRNLPLDDKLFLTWGVDGDTTGIGLYERDTLLNSKAGGGFVTWIDTETDFEFLAYVLGTSTKTEWFTTLLQLVKVEEVVSITPLMAMTAADATYVNK